MPGPPASAASTRSLGLVSATALVVANMIGTGVFTTSGFLLTDLKSTTLVILSADLEGPVHGSREEITRMRSASAPWF